MFSRQFHIFRTRIKRSMKLFRFHGRYRVNALRRFRLQDTKTQRPMKPFRLPGIKRRESINSFHLHGIKNKRSMKRFRFNGIKKKRTAKRFRFQGTCRHVGCTAFRTFPDVSIRGGYNVFKSAGRIDTWGVKRFRLVDFYFYMAEKRFCLCRTYGHVRKRRKGTLDLYFIRRCEEFLPLLDVRTHGLLAILPSVNDESSSKKARQI
jgi:hypothetical protein